MEKKKSLLCVSLVAFVLSGGRGLAGCPSADLTGDCFVDFEDFALMANQWLNSRDWNDVNTLANQWLTTDPCVPADMAYIPDGDFEMGDTFSEGVSNELPVHTVRLDSFCMGKYEVTNAQYCAYLNSALGSSIYLSGAIVYGTGNNQAYCGISTSDYYYSQIEYNDVSGTFSVRSKGVRDMSDDPMLMVSWYGAVAYCNWRSQQEGKEQCYNLSTWACNFNKHGYRLATEAEWEYAARGGLSGRRFPWGDTISHSQANYYSWWPVGGTPYFYYDVSPTPDFHPIWNDGISPYTYTSPVGFFDGSLRQKTDFNWAASQSSYQTTSGANGYGLYDMAGNVWEWCNDWYSSTYYGTAPYPHVNPTGPASGNTRVLRGASYDADAITCRVAFRGGLKPVLDIGGGFRVVLDLN
jgi:formylglycine-generating enzyme required for sulfatase activity